MDALRRYSNQHYQTYGREVVFVDYAASGPSENDEAMKRDAINIADEEAVRGDRGRPGRRHAHRALRDLAQRNILCMCTVALTRSSTASLPPMLWSSLPSINLYSQHDGRVHRQAASPASRPSTPATSSTRPRVQGQDPQVRAHLPGRHRGKVDPEGSRARHHCVTRARPLRHQHPAAAQVGYIYDPGRNQVDVTALIAKMKNEGVTTIIPIWDPLYPILITKEATIQLYFPEWFILARASRTPPPPAASTTSRSGAHAFGISPLWVTWETVPRSTGAVSTTTASRSSRRATRACSSTSTAPVLRRCSAASTWPAPTSHHDTLRRRAC